MECEAVCVVRKLSYVFTYGLDGTGDIITQCVKRVYIALRDAITGSREKRWTYGTMWRYTAPAYRYHGLPSSSLAEGVIWGARGTSARYHTR